MKLLCRPWYLDEAAGRERTKIRTICWNNERSVRRCKQCLGGKKEHHPPNDYLSAHYYANIHGILDRFNGSQTMLTQAESLLTQQPCQTFKNEGI